MKKKKDLDNNSKIIRIYTIIIVILFVILIGWCLVKKTYFGISLHVYLFGHETINGNCSDVDGSMACAHQVGSNGMLSNGSYVGYIYSENNKPNFVDGDGYFYSYKKLKKLDKNSWIYEYIDGGDDYIYIKRIKKNYFYYKINF